jgi:hypothetical protein
MNETDHAFSTTVAFPSEINTILKLIRIVSRVMFGLFLTGTCLNFLMMFLIPLSIYTRWVGLPITIFVFLGALFTTAAAIIATAMFIIFKDVITSATELNIKASVGTEMFVFMWIAAGASIIAWLIHMGMCCCCATRRDVRRGKKRGSKKAYEGMEVRDEKARPAKKRRLPTFGRTQRE